MDFHLKRGGGMFRGEVEVEREVASTWEYGDGGKKLKACEREERDRIQRLSL